VFSPGCGCVFALNKAVNLTSSDGAAPTVIDATTVASPQNVLIISSGGEFGKPGKGFTVTNTEGLSGNIGIAIDGTPIKVEGNQVVAGRIGSGGDVGIFTVNNNGEMVLIEGNQVIEWSVGIFVNSAGKTVAKNSASFNGLFGIEAAGASVVVGNVMTANGIGIQLDGSVRATGNAVYGSNPSGSGFQTLPGFTGTFEKNNMLGNGCGLRTETPALPASNNYWGASTGPGGAPADQVCDQDAGTATVTPFATKPFNVTATSSREACGRRACRPGGDMLFVRTVREGKGVRMRRTVVTAVPCSSDPAQRRIRAPRCD
jgi:hypothetical protein